MKKQNYYLSDEQIARLEALSRRTGLKVSELVRRAIDDLLNREDRRQKKEKEKG